MHIILKNPETGAVEGDLYVSRKPALAIILFCIPERLETLLQIAKSQKVPEVSIITTGKEGKDLLSTGWSPSDLIVMCHV